MIVIIFAFIHVLPYRAVRVAPFSNRLANTVPPEVQGLRCLANFEALRFAQPIRSLAEVMVQRMVQKSSRSGGKYVSVHLRFEKVGIFFTLASLICMIYASLTVNMMFSRIWLRFPAVYMMEARRKRRKWILLGKKVGEESFVEEVES